MNSLTPVFPDTGKPCPPLLTAEEVIRLLRIDAFTVKRPDITIQRLRDSGKLRAMQITRGFVYRLRDVMEFIEGGGA